MAGGVLRTGTTKEVFADPQSITAARLTGLQKYSALHPRGCAHGAADPVGMPCCALQPRCRNTALPWGSAPTTLRPAHREPAERAAVKAVSSSENPFDWNLIFLAPDGTTRLWWKVSKATLEAAAPAAPQCFAAAPEGIMPLV